MMKNKFLLVSALTLGLTLTACSNKDTTNPTVKENKTLIVGTSADYEPFEFKDKDGKIIGMDMDIINELAKRKGYKVTVKDIPFDNLLDKMNQKEVDIVIASMSATPEREKIAKFSDAYYSAKTLLVYKNGEYMTLEDLKNKKIGVQSGSVQEEYLKKLEKNFGYKIVSKKEIPELYKSLTSDEVQAISVEDTVVKGKIENEKWKSFILNGFDTSTSSIAFPKDSPYFDDFNGAITEIKSNGKLDEIVSKWIQK